MNKNITATFTAILALGGMMVAGELLDSAVAPKAAVATETASPVATETTSPADSEWKKKASVGLARAVDNEQVSLVKLVAENAETRGAPAWAVQGLMDCWIVMATDEMNTPMFNGELYLGTEIALFPLTHPDACARITERLS